MSKMSLFPSQLRFAFSHQGRKRHFFKVKEGTFKKQSQNTVLPYQYPKDLSDTSPIIHRGRPVEYLTPKHQIPERKMMAKDQIAQIDNPHWRSPPNSYALNVGLIGPVNSGKSELMAKLCGQKLSAVSPKANTTTETIEGFKSLQVDSEEESFKNVQLKYYDTAGLMYRKTGFVSKGWKVLSEIDFSLLVVDSTKRFDEMTQESIKRLEKHRNYENFMKALVLNKVDLIENRRKFQALISQIEKYGKFDKIFYTSALTGYGVDELEKYLIGMSKKRQWEQPKEVITTSTEIEIYEQLLKQCIYHRCYKEVPYNLGIQCISSATKTNQKEDLVFKVSVESENQQRMLIGTKGLNIEWIIERFKVLFAENYQKEANVAVDVRIAKKNRQSQFLSEENILDDYSQKIMQEQRLRVSSDYLRSQGKYLSAKDHPFKKLFFSEEEIAKKEQSQIERQQIQQKLLQSRKKSSGSKKNIFRKTHFHRKQP